MRTVNNRHFKLSAKISDEYATMEPALEQLVREQVKRGTVQVSLRIERPRRPEDYRLNLVALASYRDQLRGLQGSAAGTAPIDLSQLLALPGVVEEVRTVGQSPDEDWPEIARVVAQALEALEAARAAGGPGDGRRADRAGPVDRRSVGPDRRAGADGRPDLSQAAHRTGPGAGADRA